MDYNYTPSISRKRRSRTRSPLSEAQQAAEKQIGRQNNRMAAQRSREKKKCHEAELEHRAEHFWQENAQLRIEINHKDHKISQMNSHMNQMGNHMGHMDNQMNQMGHRINELQQQIRMLEQQAVANQLDKFCFGHHRLGRPHNAQVKPDQPNAVNATDTQTSFQFPCTEEAELCQPNVVNEWDWAIDLECPSLDLDFGLVFDKDFEHVNWEL